MATDTPSRAKPRRQHRGGRQVQDRDNGNGHRQDFAQGESQTLLPVIGMTGLKHMAGRVNEEYLNAIKSWTTEVKLYLEMRDDTLTGTLLDAIKAPLLAADFDVEPGGEQTPADEEAADFMWKNMNGMKDQTWVSHTEDGLECVDFGWMLAAINLEKRGDGRIWMANLEPRGQETLERWVFSEDDEGDDVEFMRQRNPNFGGGTFDVPLAQCVHFKFRGRKGNPQGHSLLRSLYRTYKFMRNLEDLEAIGVERDVGGMVVAKLSEGNLNDEDMTTLKATMKNLRKDEALYLIEPQGVEFRPWAGGSKIYDVNQIVERYQKLCLMRFFAQFLKLGMDSVGTQALVKGATDFFTLGLKGVQRYLLEAWNQQLVPYLFHWNRFPGMTGFPKIVWNEPGKPDLTSIITFLNTAVGAHLMTPTDLDEDHLRTLADMPELPEEERGAPRSAEQPPTAGLFDNDTWAKQVEADIQGLQIDGRTREDQLQIHKRLKALEDDAKAKIRG
jgi:hypothetical protein